MVAGDDKNDDECENIKTAYLNYMYSSSTTFFTCCRIYSEYLNLLFLFAFNFFTVA